MSIQSELTLLQNTKNGIRSAIMEKGVLVASNDPFAIYPTRIGQITTTPGDKDTLFRSLIERSATSLVIPNGTEKVRSDGFNNYQTLVSVTIPEGVVSIGKRAFQSCGLTVLELPNTVTSIGDYAFNNCSSLTSITCLATVPPTLEDYGHSFDNTNNCPIYVPADSVTAYQTAWPQYASRIHGIVNYAIRFTPSNGDPVVEVAMSDLTTSGTITRSDVPITILNGSIGSLEIGEGVTKIVDDIGTKNVFKDCTGLTSVTIPSTITRIDAYTFRGCTGLTSVTVNATTPPSLGTGSFDNTNNCQIYVPSGTLNSYRTATIWMTYKDRIFVYGVADWVLVSSVCEVDANNKNTGYVNNTYIDVNPSSSTYNQYDYSYEFDDTLCPIGGGTQSFVEVTDPNDYDSGTYLAAYNDNGTWKVWNSSLATTSQTATQGSNASGNYITVTATQDGGAYTIAYDTNTQAAAFDFDGALGTLKASNGLYLYRGTASAAGLLASETQPSGWGVMIHQEGTSGHYSLADTLSTVKYLKYNTANNGVFRWYIPGNQQYIKLFKLTQS